MEHLGYKSDFKPTIAWSLRPAIWREDKTWHLQVPEGHPEGAGGEQFHQDTSPGRK